MFALALMDHLESPADRPSAEVYREATELIQLADALGVKYAWFAEHHAHVHRGHLPTPLLMALHLAGKTRQIHLGMAVTCLNLHAPLDIAEQVAVADLLMEGRLAGGFGSGSTPEESAWFGLSDADETQRHANFEAALNVMCSAWEQGRSDAPGTFLPRPFPDLRSRMWIAANSENAARIAGRFGANLLFSHLRTPSQHNQYTGSYRAAGGRGLVAMNRPLYVGADNKTAFADVETAMRTLWRRFQKEGKISATESEPADVLELCRHPINFIIGGPENVRRQLRELHAACPFDVANVELRWDGLSHQQVMQSLRRLASIDFS